MLGAAAAWLTLDAVSVAANRIVPGTPHSALDVMNGWPALLLAVPMLAVAFLAWRPHDKGLRLSLAAVVALLTLLPLWLSAATSVLVTSDMPQARVAIGASLWLLLFLLLLALIELRTRLGLSRATAWLLLIPVVAGWWVALSLWLEPLALLREYQARSDQFIGALGTHLMLVGAAVAASLILAVLLVLAMRRHAGVRRVGFGVLNFLQTIPSLALFGLLLAPLAWLGARFDWLASIGVGGIGWAPAFLALLGYSLLPMVRNIHVALEEVDPAVIESAHGMGMSRRQVFLQVRLPLALPVVLEGLRITTVQAIGLTAVAALIGAGGLGTFIFQGLGQAAMDMVLLGALPIIALALLADALFGSLSECLRPGGAA
ncbi:ABC transporter permease [Billgrantia lactosivorans]|uniref:ABC transporter permease n=1 Tax=Billgrantia lactosivorans TaxID=2185141 RepID=UPI000DAB41EC|nr:ABC transporter permease [Halomonas lactosivorans]